MKNLQIIFEYTIGILKEMSIKHEYHNFESGAIMLDIWHNNKFYCLQFDPEGWIGFSDLNEENISFDTSPDVKFFDKKEYLIKLNRILIKE